MAIQVQTSHNVVIDYEPAGLGYRLLAYILDWIFIILWIIIWRAVWLGIIAGHLGRSSNVFEDIFDGVSSWFNIVSLLILLVPIVFYDLLFEYFNKGRSLGKMICQTRVISVDGSTPSLGAYLIRWIFRPIDFTITYGLLAIIMIALNKKSQRLGDYLANTTVIDTRLSRNNRELSITDLDFHDAYKVSYPNVLYQLSDRDIQSILSILNNSKNLKNNEYLKDQLITKVQSITGYNFDTTITGEHFLRTIVNDYHYLATQE